MFVCRCCYEYFVVDLVDSVVACCKLPFCDFLCGVAAYDLCLCFFDLVAYVVGGYGCYYCCVCCFGLDWLL